MSDSEDRVAGLRASLASRGYKLVPKAGKVETGKPIDVLGITGDVLHIYRHPGYAGLQVIVRRPDGTPGLWYMEA